MLTTPIFPVISSNFGNVKRMGGKSRKFVQENYGWDVIAKKTEKFYKEIIKNFLGGKSKV